VATALYCWVLPGEAAATFCNVTYRDGIVQFGLARQWHCAAQLSKGMAWHGEAMALHGMVLLGKGKATDKRTKCKRGKQT
jgi:hypothetical protein